MLKIAGSIHRQGAEGSTQHGGHISGDASGGHGHLEGR